jgi:hypothetical protein
MGQPSIQVRANRLGQLPGSDPHYHLYIVVNDGKGNLTYYRGGPSGDGGSSGGSSGATRGTTSSGRSSGESGFGKIETEYGAHVPGSIDYQEDSRVIHQSNLNPGDVSRVKANLASQMDAIEGANINYFPTGPNSNSVVGTATRNMGLDVQIPSGMWVPGVETQLINRNGQRVSSNNTGDENSNSSSSTKVASLTERLGRDAMGKGTRTVAQAQKSNGALTYNNNMDLVDDNQNIVASKDENNAQSGGNNKQESRNRHIQRM